MAVAAIAIGARPGASAVPAGEIAALGRLYNTSRGAAWGHVVGWGHGDPCTWNNKPTEGVTPRGVFCTPPDSETEPADANVTVSHVDELWLWDIPFFADVSSVFDAVAALPHLSRLDLHMTVLYGTIPNSIDRCTLEAVLAAAAACCCTHAGRIVLPSHS